MPEELKTMHSLAPSPPERVEFEACLSDDEVLGFVQGRLPVEALEHVHRHADRCSDCQLLLAEATRALDVEPAVESARTSWNAVFQPRTLVAKRYRILRLVARGGMGEIYEAFDTVLEERVALKTVTSTTSDNTFAVSQLMAEVQLARRIAHPNVCRIHDLGMHEIAPSGAEIHFLVMEFVDGECLGKKLRNTGALSLNLSVSIAHQLLLGLRAAHRAGILHRDFKSENVMLRPEAGGKVHAVILDFGLARVLNETGRISTEQSRDQAMVGTFGYMAPEQIEGVALTRASDIYSFGVVWFEMLTGRLPFDGASPAASALARLHRDPEPPSSINPQIPKRIDAIVLRCLSRERAARYSDAQEVIDALIAFVSSRGTERTKGLARWYWALALVALLTSVLAVSFSRRSTGAHDARTWNIRPIPGLKRASPLPPLDWHVPLLNLRLQDGTTPVRGSVIGAVRTSFSPKGTSATPRPGGSATPASPGQTRRAPPDSPSAPNPIGSQPLPGSTAEGAVSSSAPAPGAQLPRLLPLRSRPSESKSPSN